MADNLIEKEPTTQTISTNKKRKYIPFWGEDPNVLFASKYLMEFFPTESMTYEQKLNSVTRTVILLTLVSTVLYGGIRHLIIGAITIGSIFILQYYHQKERVKVESKKVVEEVKEGFANPAMDLLTQGGEEIPTDLFDEPEPSNPFSNVMMTDYDYNPNKKPAPPSFTKDGNGVIVQNTKDMVQDLNPGQPNIEKKLYNDINTNMELEQSLRQFYSTANTTIPNNQAGFAEFCYGNMISGKEENKIALTRENPRHIMR